jgi:hypothetical protein
MVPLPDRRPEQLSRGSLETEILNYCLGTRIGDRWSIGIDAGGSVGADRSGGVSRRPSDGFMWFASIYLVTISTSISLA